MKTTAIICDTKIRQRKTESSVGNDPSWYQEDEGDQTIW